MASRMLLQTLLMAGAALGQNKWCGKNYEHGSPIEPPGGNFPQLKSSPSPLLAFRCSPGVVPYLPSDSASTATLLVDAFVTNTVMSGTSAIDGGLPASFHVTAKAGGKTVASGTVPANTTKHSLPLSLKGLHSSVTPLDLECTLTSGNQTFAASSSLSYFPENKNGSTTKRDLKTGALLAKSTTGQGSYEPVFPVGFYTNFGGYIADNLTILDDIKAQGFTVVHPVPTYDNLTALDLVIDRMEELGLWLMYDMRWTYTNLTAVQAEVNRIKNRPNLLLWYTADEPDGWQDPLNATTLAYDTIYSLDQGYHPVSLVLNCQDYYYPEYAAGADILLQDTYPIGNNVTWSNQFDTPCTPDYGDCGCDNCRGNLTDISDRMDTFAARDQILGWDTSKSVWAVPQGFGNETYWTRYPTGQEWIVQAVIAINHGAKGVISWNDPTTDGIQGSASALAKAMPKINTFLFSHSATFQGYLVDGVDVGVWQDGSKTLVLATNTAYTQATVPLSAVGIHSGRTHTAVLNKGVRIVENEFVLVSVGTGGFVFHA